MKETLALIHNITGTTPKLVRPPYGSAPGLKGEEIRNQIVEAGIKVWDWTIDSNDWKLKGNPQQIIENVKRTTTEDVEVVLMHENHKHYKRFLKLLNFIRKKDMNSGYTMKRIIFN